MHLYALCHFMPIYAPLCPFMPLMPLYAPLCPFTSFYMLYKLSSSQDLVVGLVTSDCDISWPVCLSQRSCEADGSPAVCRGGAHWHQRQAGGLQSGGRIILLLWPTVQSYHVKLTTDVHCGVRDGRPLAVEMWVSQYFRNPKQRLQKFEISRVTSWWNETAINVIW